MEFFVIFGATIVFTPFIAIFIFSFALSENRTRLWELVKSNYGRNFGWWVEYEGERIAELVNYQFSDMFWDLYDIVPIKEGYKKILQDKDFWEEGKFVFRNKKFNETVPHAFCGGNPEVSEGYIIMRGLYLQGKNRYEEYVLNGYSIFFG